MQKRAALFGIEIDALRARAAADTILSWLDDTDRGCRFVVTPNVDHLVKLQNNEQFRSAYRAASLVLADGFPLVVAARLFGSPLPERVAGSELLPLFFDRAESRSSPTSVFLLGAMPGVADRAARYIQQQWPHVRVTGTCSPDFGFEHDQRASGEILEQISRSGAEVLVVGVGAPKQEIWVHRHQRQLPVRAAFCVGATIDFLAGVKPQAPPWMRRNGLEWLHRVACEPRRLAGRYAIGACWFPWLCLREWLGGTPMSYYRSRDETTGCGGRP